MVGEISTTMAFSRGRMPTVRTAVPLLYFLVGALVLVCIETVVALSPSMSVSMSSTPLGYGEGSSSATRFVLLGGTGKIGTAVAAHLSHRLSSANQQPKKPLPECEIVLVGRQPSNNDENNDCFEGALQEIKELLELERTDSSSSSSSSSSPLPIKITYECVPDIWKPGALDGILRAENKPPVSCVIHTAGPYADRDGPVALESCIDFKIPVYVDVSDPIEFLEDSLAQHESAIAAGTTAILAAGAFPGMSNILALEAAATATEVAEAAAAGGGSTTTTSIKDVRFNYFTKGLGGSGTINLYITNIGFGDPMVMHDMGTRARFDDLSGRLLGTVDFFIDQHDTTKATSRPPPWKEANARAKDRVGTQKVFAWPFPEAATVPSVLSISGSSSSAMGTAPDLWNDMLGLLVDLVPRPWWRSRKFSKFLADFSEPLVKVTDLAMRTLSGDGDCGETHAMRVDVVAETVDERTGTSTETMVSIVQCHDSFRRCVGQSCAEFALDAWFQYREGDNTKTGVYLPEQRYSDASDRRRIVDKLTSTPGTFCYTGPVVVGSGPAESSSSFIAGEPPLERIVLKNTPTPGLICNGAPMQIILERPDDDDDDDTENSGGRLSREDGSDRPLSQKLPVYPTEIREIVRASKNNNGPR